MVFHTTIDDLLNQIHKQNPHLVSSVMLKNGDFVFIDDNGLPRATLNFTPGPFGSVSANYFNFDKKLQPKETV